MHDYENERNRHENLAAQIGGLSLEAIRQDLYNKEIALIGNAESIFSMAFGNEIDSNEVVIRINKGFIIDHDSQGTRTDILASSYPLSEEDIKLKFNVSKMLWMTPKLQVMQGYGDEVRKMTFIHPYKWWYELYVQLGNTRPTTGMMLIQMLVKHIPARRVRLFGFDFFQTKTFYEETLRQDTPHDFLKEQNYVTQLIGQGHPVEIFG